MMPSSTGNQCYTLDLGNAFVTLREVKPCNRPSAEIMESILFQEVEKTYLLP